MTRIVASPQRLVVVMVAVLLAGACGKKGPPLAPLTIVPQRVDDVTARRRGEAVEIAFTIPTRDSTGASPGDIGFVEVYALTGSPVDRSGRPLDDREFLRHATLVSRLEVEPPPEAPEEGADPAAPPPDDPRPAQGEQVLVSETLVPATLQLVVIPDRSGNRGRSGTEVTQAPQPLSWPDASSRQARHYVAVALSARGRRGRLSEPVALPLADVPPPAVGPQVTYTESSASVAWAVPPTAHVSMFAAAGTDELDPRLILRGAIPHTYNVYAWDGAAADGAVQATPLNTEPLALPSMELPALTFGTPRCFAVRAVERSGRATVEGSLSPATCITPVDAFPPESPRSLAAVGSEGGVSLIWDANAEADLAGYIVLRGAVPAEPTQELTPAAVKETTFRDTTAAAGTRYSYAVIAVDTAGNRSRPSNQVEDAAR